MPVITIHSLYRETPTQPYQVDVSKGALVNPFAKSGKESILNVKQYDTWFYRQLSIPNMDIVKELNRCFHILEKYNKLEFFCWCAPKACHAEIIREVLLECYKQNWLKGGNSNG